MLRTTTLLTIGITTTLSAQSVCERGPGVPFGITEYSCSNCAIDRPAGQRKSYVFKDDPVVVERTTNSPFQPGDRVTAVDGKGLVTPDGARGFAYPKAGVTVVQIIRKIDGNDRLLYSVINIGADCQLESATPGSATLPTILSNQTEVDSAKLQSARPARVTSSCKHVGLRVVNNSGAAVIVTATILDRRYDILGHVSVTDSIVHVVGTAPTGMSTLDLPRPRPGETPYFSWDWASADARGDLKQVRTQQVCLD